MLNGDLQDDLNVHLKLTGQKQLGRVNNQLTKDIKFIANNVSKTGYAKIAELVEMPADSDTPQCEKGGQKQKKREEELKREDSRGGASGNGPTTSDLESHEAKYTKKLTSKETKKECQEYTMSEVQGNNTDRSSWTAVNGRVYDITDFIHRHPGGYQVISQAVGRDGSEVFSKYSFF